MIYRTTPTLLRLGLILVLSLTSMLAGCSKTPDEELIQQQIDAVQQAVERKAFTEIPDYLHHDFIANGHMGADEIKRLLQMYSLQHRRIGVTILSSETTLDPYSPDRAETTLSVAVTGSSGLLPTDGSMRPVRVVWEKYSGDWLVIEADWQQRRH